MRRFNPHIAVKASSEGVVALVDSTRKGKRFPDAFTRTVPIWVSVVNRAVYRLRQMQRGLEMPKVEEIPAEWCAIQLPEWISASEVRQVSPKIEEFCTLLLTSEVIRPTMEDLVTRVEKPLKCLWIAPGTNENLHALDLPTEVYNWVVLLCPSDEQSEVQAEHVWYVQGAADDEETWAQGLTAQLFWKHKDMLMEREELLTEKIAMIIANKSAEAKDAVARHTNNENSDLSATKSENLDDKSSLDKLADYPIEKVSWIVPNALAISSDVSTCAPSAWSHFDIVINCSSMEYEALAEAKPESKKYMRLVDPFEKGNNVKFKLSRRLPGTLEFVKRYFRASAPIDPSNKSQRPSNVLEASSSSSPSSTTKPSQESACRPLLIHGVESIHIAIGLAIGILVENFDSDGATLLPSPRAKRSLSKTLIKQCLLQVSKFIPEQLPSVMIADLNRYFLSTPEPGVAAQQSQLLAMIDQETLRSFPS